MNGATKRLNESVLLRNKILKAIRSTACIKSETKVGSPIELFSLRSLNIAMATTPARTYINSSLHPLLSSSITERQTKKVPVISPISVLDKRESITKKAR